MSEAFVPVHYSTITTEKIGLVAWLFHVVKNPSDGSIWHFVPQGSYADVEGLLRPGWHHTVEAPILDTSVSVVDKSMAIGRQFSQAGKTIALLPPKQRGPTYVHSTDEYLSSGMYPEITSSAADILPETVVLGAMFDSFVLTSAQMRCHPLEEWLQDNSAA